MTHPLFLGALALLAINDHVLKGSGLLPGALTGKLSDFAGLLVAPLVLAWLVRARGPRAVLGCHVAVGVGFSLLQVPPIATAFNTLALIHVWPDPTDLIALPMLAVSYRALPFERAGRRPRELVLGVFALLTCAATGPAPPASRYPYPPGGFFEGDVVVRHVGSEDQAISVQRLRDETEVDCDAMLEAPESALLGAGFAEARDWTLARGDAVPLWDRRGGAVDRECYAVRLTARGVVWLVAWRHGEPALREVDVRLDVGEPAEPEAMVIANSALEPPRAPEGVTVRRAP